MDDPYLAEEIPCGISGEIIEIDYGDAKVGRTTRIVTVERLYKARRILFIDGLCHLRAENRTFRLDRIHFIRELSQSGAYPSVIGWMGSYGVKLKVEYLRGLPTYVLLTPKGIGSDESNIAQYAN